MSQQLQQQQRTTTATSSVNDMWLNKCVDYMGKIIRYYSTNDMSHLSPQMLDLVSTIRNVCIETQPVDVNVTKRFDNDENLIKHYARLQQELGSSEITSDIFRSSFVYNVLPAYAHKFYNNNAAALHSSSVEEAARQLGFALEYQIAEAIATNTPIPLPFDQKIANDYMTLLLQRATIPQNIQNAIEYGMNDKQRYPRLLMINTIINNVIDDLFGGNGSDYYLYTLNERNRSRVLSLKRNISQLAPLSASTDIFKFIANLSTEKGINASLFESAAALTSTKNTESYKTPCQQSLTELAFQNEALRRFIFQQLSYKQNLNN
ncbi:41 kDa glycoprotein [Pseudoplusia includens SNPV IE]|uniref:GP41 n=2 Tax=Chrysodeixis includens nucleopolyhedrovirus TaxID=1207438 RepID=A0A1C8ZXV7_9ABAC|nr:41 kDa glycoprotein [Pseudoplusia includens SNPV IE]AOL56512.1 GP41 [Chrysodeixis includens nucleopolyhedrovirus]AJD80766.1 41 kDa glycoprotein [Pseudoplusia includens SNPV IE]AOL56654.1 GP41 [Chrysodeixis includens nucleopolyhedrovirus]AOL56795.1 GP41 [Chrysodeixis includens nucleopolyhedrovirus]AOL56937.1 GP41 [Chrysodeixis includens nucleopolyhedrovirus]